MELHYKKRKRDQMNKRRTKFLILSIFVLIIILLPSINAAFYIYRGRSYRAAGVIERAYETEDGEYVIEFADGREYYFETVNIQAWSDAESAEENEQVYTICWEFKESGSHLKNCTKGDHTGNPQ